MTPNANETFWMPEAASSSAGSVDALFYGILAVSVVCFIGITAAVIYFVVKYRHREGHAATPSASHNDALELTWTIIPSIVAAIIFVFGWKGFADMNTAPKHAMEILVTGQKWSWQFQYPNGHVDSVLHVPVDQEVRLVMKSDDVIHSFYVPAFRIKQDVLPQRYTELWFRATRTGTFRVYCAEYCGTRHSDMKTEVVVHERGGPDTYEAYLEQAAEKLLAMPPRELGALLYEQRGCKNCHTTDGGASTGPTFLGAFGSQVTLRDGTTVAFDENYARESILDPQAKVHTGFNPVMPTFQGKLKDREITALIEFMKGLER